MTGMALGKSPQCLLWVFAFSLFKMEISVEVPSGCRQCASLEKRECGIRKKKKALDLESDEPSEFLQCHSVVSISVAQVFLPVRGEWQYRLSLLSRVVVKHNSGINSEKVLNHTSKLTGK